MWAIDVRGTFDVGRRFAPLINRGDDLAGPLPPSPERADPACLGPTIHRPQPLVPSSRVCSH